MGVTITIQDNQEYCQANKLVGQRKYDCQCNYPGAGADPTCRECGGKGEVVFDDFPYEFSICYSHWYDIMEDMRLNGECECGSMDPKDFIDAAKNCRLSVLQKDLSYYMILMEIAVEAKRREKMIVWA